MTTLDEISACPEKNRAFWTEHAAFHLVLFRLHRDSAAEAQWQRANFRKNMAHRREQTYLG